MQGAFRPVPEALKLNLLHDGGMEVGTAYLHDGPERIEFRADVNKSSVFTMIQDAYIRGASIEFHTEDESRDPDGTRVIERGRLVGLALVRRSSYPRSRIELRARSGRTLRATIPVNRDLQCECIATGGGGAECAAIVRFEEGIAAELAETIGRAFEDAQAGIVGRDVLAVQKDYSNPIASARRGTLRARATDAGVAIEADLPAGRVGDDVVAASESAGIVARPLIDYASPETKFVDTATGRVVERARVRAILIGSTDSRAGWDDAVIDYDGENRAAPAPAGRRRVWL